MALLPQLQKRIVPQASNLIGGPKQDSHKKINDVYKIQGHPRSKMTGSFGQISALRELLKMSSPMEGRSEDSCMRSNPRRCLDTIKTKKMLTTEQWCAIFKTDHRCHKHVTLKKKKCWYPCRLLQRSSLKEEAVWLDNRDSTALLGYSTLNTWCH
jgi:hypothetical protein